MVTYKVCLPNGGVLEIEATPRFVEIVANHYNVKTNEVTPDLVKSYVTQAVSSAVQRAESELK